ncbi:MAG: type III-B CRISPR module RAMP protein Cmr1, partial [Candidatus Omnitrophica bacterium]|nr:type III-B CRISPR module RAMP protein Cmr1 [Candidatus Omnitrophota bacterium]
EIELITPMFMSGADLNQAEIRPPSIKGMMRFWWRAMRAEDNIQSLKNEEAKIFGGVDGNAMKSTFTIKLTEQNIKWSRKSFPYHSVSVAGKNFKINILEYLSYGTYKYQKSSRKNIFIRDYAEPGSKFCLDIFVKRQTLNDILISLYFLTSFGGLGSRCRNGFGSVHILNREIFEKIGNDYKENIVPTRNMITFQKKIPLYPAFSTSIKLFKTETEYETWDKTLAEIGKIYRDARATIEKSHSYDLRQYIGAPLDPPGENFKSFLDRHAKPYFLKVIRTKSGKYCGYILYLPSRYCTGLNKDRNKNHIDHKKVDEAFLIACQKLNSFLKAKMQEVI